MLKEYRILLDMPYDEGVDFLFKLLNQNVQGNKKESINDMFLPFSGMLACGIEMKDEDGVPEQGWGYVTVKSDALANQVTTFVQHKNCVRVLPSAQPAKKNDEGK